jgi:hypothetical protein
MNTGYKSNLRRYRFESEFIDFIKSKYHATEKSCSIIPEEFINPSPYVDPIIYNDSFQNYTNRYTLDILGVGLNLRTWKNSLIKRKIRKSSK